MQQTKSGFCVELENLSFGNAIEAAKRGTLITRKGWNGKSQFVFVRPADQLSVNFIINTVKSLPDQLKKQLAVKFEGQDRDEVKVNFTPYLCLFNAQGDVVNGWVPSQGDMFSDDWEILMI